MGSLTKATLAPVVHSRIASPYRPSGIDSDKLLGMRIDLLTYKQTTSILIDWALNRESRYFCACNVHMVMEGVDTESFQQQVNKADLVSADSAGVALGLSLLRKKKVMRVMGPNLMLDVCDAAAKNGIPIGLYGSTDDCVKRLQRALQIQFPELNIVCSISPPFRPLSHSENQHYIDKINASGARILFVGLGCPQQEAWMATQHGKINAVMMGVGAAFDFHAGLKKRAPLWMQRIGIEWVFRLYQEPKRLWKRNVKHAPRFIWGLLFDIVLSKTSFRKPA